MRLTVAVRAAAVALALVGSCAGPLQFYDDTYYPQDRIYENTSLGFALVFTPGWRIMASPAAMDRTRRAVATMLRKKGAELLFAGETLERRQGTRAIAEHLNRTNEEYLATVRALNVFSIEQDFGAVMFAGGNVPMIKWEYAQGGCRYVEFLFRAGTHNVRVAFWTTPDRYAEFLPVYERIMATLSLRVYPESRSGTP